jgi:osmoprotectant transport system permease protein
MKTLVFVMMVHLVSSPPVAQAQPIVVGSKMDVEGQILAEILSQTLEKVGEAKVERKYGMGGTGIVLESLRNGHIDIYPEYSGTLWNMVIKKPPSGDPQTLDQELNRLDLAASAELGFNNTYGLAMRSNHAKSLNIKLISDLGKHGPALTAGFSPEFLNFKDNFPLLKKQYNLNFKSASALDHSLAYEALSKNQVDVIDVYTTDAKIPRFDLVILKDDLSFFPMYRGLFLTRSDFSKKYPKSWAAVQSLSGQISEEQMIQLNAAVEIDKVAVTDLAKRFLDKVALSGPPEEAGFFSFQKRYVNNRLATLTAEHLILVAVSLLAAVLIGVPLGVLSHSKNRVGQIILAACGVIQTIPSLALLCFLIPWLGIGIVPALAALFLYGLLPIVQGTYSGLQSLNPQLVEAAQTLRLSPRQTLFWVKLPLSWVAIANGIKVSAVINVGTATMAAFIGGGGYGTYIVTGLALNDIPMMLNGAIPAALLALLINLMFEYRHNRKRATLKVSP